MGYFFLLFLVVPAVELWLLIEIGSRIGVLPTLAMIVVTGVVGATAARRQGIAVLARARQDFAGGTIPGDALLDGLLILLAGALLITPGVLTDAVGLLLLVPPLRRLVRRAVKRRIERSIREGRMHVHVDSGPGRPPEDRPPGAGKIIDQDEF